MRAMTAVTSMTAVRAVGGIEVGGIAVKRIFEDKRPAGIGCIFGFGDGGLRVSRGEKECAQCTDEQSRSAQPRH
jgi:hypothetical protein